MTEKELPTPQKPAFNPFLLIGTFWTIFGLLVLLSSFFVTGSRYVPVGRAVGANLIASLILLGIGIGMLIKGRRQP
ncbi:hypothetical protein JW992_04020 [candidate division KSB1 bacterium]|nr:hypothetical protein [candidate division KSB1 bacterium]